MASKLLRGRRVFRLIAFLGVAGLVFVIFQIFSVEVLNKISNEADNMKIVAKQLDSNALNVLPGNQPDPDCLRDGKKCAKYANHSKAVIQGPDKLYLDDDTDNMNIKEQFKNRLGGGHARPDHFVLDDNVVKPDSDSYEKNYLNENYDFRSDNGYELNNEKLVGLNDVVAGDTNLPLGVPKALAKQYQPDEQDMFMCLTTKEKIDWSRVNDDYCDCRDSSDEPGTSACPDSEFYCKLQVPGSSRLKQVSGSKVNDGICDCCDGSDEWQDVRLADRLLLNDGKEHYGIRQGPCADRCSEVQAEVKRKSVIHQQGAKIKQQYIDNLQAHMGFNSKKLYGRDGAYYMLSEECFTRSSDKYQYTVCPFRDVKQSDGASITVIGRNGSWLANHRLQMSGGESNQCPGMRRRTAILEFECSVQNQILSVQETEVCEYTFRFSTPAAC